MDQLREEVNPVFHTAESCLLVNAQLGDTDAARILEHLEFYKKVSKSDEANMTPEMREFAAHSLNPGFNAMVEARFGSSSRLILESGYRRVVDLPCGYTPRGIKLANTSLRYYGLDLPAVIDEMAGAVEQEIGKNKRISYRAVDATNYDSLKQALRDAEGPLLITTEGMLMYFIQTELDEVFRNIRSLLLEYGGEWVTSDNEMLAAQNRLMTCLLDNDPEEMEKLRKFTEERIAKAAPPGNEFLRVQAVSYVEDMGFDLTKVPVFDYLPEPLHALSAFSEEKQKAARETFREMYFWVMTPNRDESLPFMQEGESYRLSAEVHGSRFFVSVSGRLDTITAPEFLSVFRKASEKTAISRITIDMDGLSYLSSAGLRALMIMRKTVKDPSGFRIVRACREVKDIIMNAGLEEFLNIR